MDDDYVWKMCPNCGGTEGYQEKNPAHVCEKCQTERLEFINNRPECLGSEITKGFTIQLHVGFISIMETEEQLMNLRKNHEELIDGSTGMVPSDSNIKLKAVNKTASKVTKIPK